MAKSKALTKLDPVDTYFAAQMVAEQSAMGNFHEAVRRGMPELIEKAIAEVASRAFTDGLDFANTLTARERKLIG